MNKYKHFNILKLPEKILLYGLFASLVHIFAITLYCRYLFEEGEIIFYNVFPDFLHYSIMSVTLVICGAVLTAFVARTQKNRED